MISPALSWDFWNWDWAQFALFFILGAAPIQTVFVLAYGLFSPFWREPIGRALLGKSFMLAALLDVIFIAYVTHTAVPRPVATFLYGGTLVGVTWQLVAFSRIRWGRDGRARQAGLWHIALARFRRFRDR